jgi:hypothetical protein
MHPGPFERPGDVLLQEVLMEPDHLRDGAERVVQWRLRFKRRRIRTVRAVGFLKDPMMA